MARNAKRVERIKQIGRDSARVTIIATQWTGERLLDLSMWPVNLIRDLPLRVARLAVTLWRGLRGLLGAFPGSAQALWHGGPSGLADWAWHGIQRSGAWLGRLVMQILDLVGIPELFSLFWRAATHSSPLTGAEIAALAEVLGPMALRYRDVRVAEGGILRLVFALNKGRAFTTFYTVSMPDKGPHSRANLPILVHELVHVYQHERLGSAYIGECLHAQATNGYEYGGPLGLREAEAQGKHYCDFNREQQARIVQDYFAHLCHLWDASDYRPFIDEMCRGKI